MGQAPVLNTMFGTLARRAALNVNEHFDSSQRFCSIALKAQNHCRLALEALSAVKEPPDLGIADAGVSGGTLAAHERNSVAEKAAHVTACSQLCDRTSECMAFTSHIPSHRTITAFRASIQNRIRFSRIHVLESTSLPGGDYRTISDISFEDFIDSCSGDDRCVGMAYSRKQSQCRLKSRLVKAAKDRIASGIKILSWEGIWAPPGSSSVQEPELASNPIQLSYARYVGMTSTATLKT
jgi:hypothetical protein